MQKPETGIKNTKCYSCYIDDIVGIDVMEM